MPATMAGELLPDSRKVIFTSVFLKLSRAATGATFNTITSPKIHIRMRVGVRFKLMVQLAKCWNVTPAIVHNIFDCFLVAHCRLDESARRVGKLFLKGEFPAKI